MSLKYFKKDLEACSNSKVLSIMLKNLIVSHTVHLTLLFRLGQTLNLIPLIGAICRVFIEYLIRIIYSSDLSCKSSVGPGLSIVHGHDLVIGADVVIGDNCKIFNGVTFGNKDLHKSSHGNQPTVGNDCVFCTGAKILGPITISNNVIVAANAVLISDAPKNSIMGGIPAKVIKVNS
ncbi:serine acetyltransferase [Shewanella glacialipiscicola]|uniref:serine O-acetyltransferase n=1 Tax=Shewanella glacialipiscicola TaxID=614069 RepID=UPI0021D8F9E3|nr:serine acetyltransferase [Shewanella glacialipiscicola]MCU7995606.1 serine acetyltransferase [Shewanella glacialipiscicola]MCU8026853.1 serine acetyltransferase [Shewanella glacialipiscicola]